jgi:hypothetical protein
MTELVKKIARIQNKSKSLQWGYCQHAEDEYMFVVGSLAYPSQIQYFTITNDYAINCIDDAHHRILFRQCNSANDVTDSIIELLKKWFPAKC